MTNPRKLFKIIILISIVGFFAVNSTIHVEAQAFLTEEEKDYIANCPVLKGVTIDGVAPLHYTNSKGEIKGITIRIFDEISKMTGLRFEYELFGSVEEALQGDYHVYLSAVKGYAPDYMIFSKPYLKSETILFINSSINPNHLENKIYAGVKGGTLPQGVKEENTICFGSREDTLNAVEKGKADYGYGNAYSVAYYTIMYDYKNIVSIPIRKEGREYCIGFPKEDKILLSIINKAIDAIDKSHMQTLILDTTSHIERKINFSMVMDNYGEEIIAIFILIIALLSYSFISSIKANKRLRLQNKRYEALSDISNEYLYDYSADTGKLELSAKSVRLFGGKERLEEISHTLREAIFSIDESFSKFFISMGGNYKEGNEGYKKPTDAQKKTEAYTSIIELPLANGEIGIFKTINTIIKDDKGRTDSVIGKLIDISKEMEEKEKLIIKSQLDGLTGLYNPTTTRNLIAEIIKNKNKGKMDALIIIDCDNFKAINDNFGHLKGDEVLKNISKALKHTFRQTDIIGRIGGDEFCIYMKNIPSREFVKIKSHQLFKHIQETNRGFYVSISIGIAFLKEDSSYEELFEKADNALYKAKEKGGGEIIIYSGE